LPQSEIITTDGKKPHNINREEHVKLDCLLLAIHTSSRERQREREKARGRERAKRQRETETERDREREKESKKEAYG